MGDRIDVRKTYKLFIGGVFPRSESGRSYRPPLVSWTDGAETTEPPNSYRDDELGLEFQYPAGWGTGAQPIPFRSCTDCITLGSIRRL